VPQQCRRAARQAPAAAAQVLFLEVAAGEGREQLLLLEAEARRAFSAHGLLPPGCKPFEPHVTVAKLSRLRGRRGWPARRRRRR
jgi:2'-5' RNA ligase